MRFFWWTFSILIIVAGLFYLFIFSPVFQIQEIRISGNEKVEKTNIENLIQNQIISNFKFLKTKSIWLINLKKINNSLLENFPQIAKVNLKRKFPNTLEVKIEEKKPIAIFCQNDNYFLIDEEGVVYEKVNDERINQFFKILDLTLIKEIELGERVIGKEEISKILEIKSKLTDDLKIPIEEIAIGPEKRLNVKTQEGWEIYFVLKEDLNWEITKLKVVLENRIPPEKRKNLKYIDLRFEKVYISPEGLFNPRPFQQ